MVSCTSLIGDLKNKKNKKKHLELCPVVSCRMAAKAPSICFLT